MVLWQKFRWVYSGYKPRSLTNKEPGWVFAFLLKEDIVKRNNKQPPEGCDDFWKFYNEYYLQPNIKLP